MFTTATLARRQCFGYSFGYSFGCKHLCVSPVSVTMRYNFYRNSGYWNISFCICCLERKYLIFTPPFSKMSNSIDSFPVLWYSEIFCVKHFPLDIIPQLLHFKEDGSEVIPSVAAKHSLNIFVDKPCGSISFFEFTNCSEYFTDKGTSVAVKTFSVSGNGEILTRRSESPDVGSWHVSTSDKSNII